MLNSKGKFNALYKYVPHVLQSFMNSVQFMLLLLWLQAYLNLLFEYKYITRRIVLFYSNLVLFECFSYLLSVCMNQFFFRNIVEKQFFNLYLTIMCLLG